MRMKNAKVPSYVEVTTVLTTGHLLTFMMRKMIVVKDGVPLHIHVVLVRGIVKVIVTANQHL